MTHTWWMGSCVLTLRRWMVHFGKWNQWETHFLPPFISEWGCCSGAQDAPESFPITSKMDNVITRYLRLFSIKKLSNYCSLSWGSQVAQHEGWERWGPWMSCQKPYRIWLPNCSSFPWLSVINLIRYSFNKKKLHSPWKNASALWTRHNVKSTAFSRRCQGSFIFLFNLGSGKKGIPLCAVLLGHTMKGRVGWKAGQRQKKCFFSCFLHLETYDTS